MERFEVRRFPARKGREFSVFDKQLDYVVSSWPSAIEAETHAVEAEKQHRVADAQARVDAAGPVEVSPDAVTDEAAARLVDALLAS